MRYSKYMKLLTNHFVKSEARETTIEYLANLFDCSERHAKTIINYLDKEKFVDWKVKRGRGKKPKLKLHYTFDGILLEEAKHYIKQEKYQEGFSIMEQLEKSSQTEFQEWLNTYLGLMKKTETNQDLDVLRYSFYETKLQMDPLQIRSRHDGHMVQQIFDRLVEFDPKSGKLTPRIAHHFESKDGMHWIFYLRKGVLFHHGRELNSADVKATFERFPSTNRFMKNVKEITCASDYVVVFQLKEVDFMFPRYLSSIATSIIPVEMLEKKKKFSDNPIGSGPFQLTEQDKEIIRLEVFPRYYGLRPWLDRIEIIKTPASFQHEETHPLLLSAPNTSWKEVKVVEEGADFIVFNCAKKGPLQDQNIRAQISEWINPQTFCLEGEVVAHSFHTKVSAEQKTPVIDYSVQPVHLDMELLIGAQQIREGVNHEREALILKEQLENAGISTKVEIVNATDFKNPVVIHKYDILVSGVALSEDHLLSSIITLTSSQLALYHCLSDEMRGYIMEQERRLKETKDERARWDIYFEMEIFLKEQHLLFFLNHRSHNIFKPSNSTYMNIELDSNGRIDYRNVWQRIE